MTTVVKQRVGGLVGGIAYVSTADYYIQMNELVNRLSPGHSSRVHLVSIDIYEYVEFLEKSAWSSAVEYILSAVEQLSKTKIDFLVICSNTGKFVGHIAAKKINELYPNLVLLHIGDAIAYEIKKKKLKKIGFIGTKFSMKHDSAVVERLALHDFEIIFPNQEEIENIHRIIIDELSFNIFKEESKNIYVHIIERLHNEHHVEGIVLGCTEIPMLVKQNDYPTIPLFDSTKLHVQLAVEYQLACCDIDAFLPNKRE